MWNLSEFFKEDDEDLFESFLALYNEVAGEPDMIKESSRLVDETAKKMLKTLRENAKEGAELAFKPLEPTILAFLLMGIIMEFTPGDLDEVSFLRDLKYNLEIWGNILETMASRKENKNE